MSLLGDPKGRSSDLLQVGAIVFFLSQQAEQSFSLNPADRGARKPTISLYGPIAGKFVLAHDAPLSWLSSNGGKASYSWNKIRSLGASAFLRIWLLPGSHLQFCEVGHSVV